MNWIEIAGFITGVAGVWLTIKQNKWCWPTGLLNVILYIFFFYQVKLFADMWLQIFYVVTLVYGWIEWTKGTSNNKILMVTFSSKRLLAFSMLAASAMTLLFGYFFSHYTQAALPWWDSSLTALSLVATWMTAKKKIENWLVWIVADAAYVVIYLVKDARLTAILYFIFLLLAFKGYREWKLSWEKNVRTNDN